MAIWRSSSMISAFVVSSPVSLLLSSSKEESIRALSSCNWISSSVRRCSLFQSDSLGRWFGFIVVLPSGVDWSLLLAVSSIEILCSWLSSG